MSFTPLHYRFSYIGSHVFRVFRLQIAFLVIAVGSTPSDTAVKMSDGVLLAT